MASAATATGARLTPVALSCAVFVILATLLSLSPTADDLLIVLTAVAIAFPWMVLKAGRQRVDLFSPLMVFTIMWGAMFVLRPLAMKSSNDFTLRGTYDISDGLQTAQELAFAGALAFAIGYLYMNSRSVAGDQRKTRPLDVSASSGYGTFLSLVGSTAAIASFGNSLGGTSAYVYYLPLLSVPGLLLLCLAKPLPRVRILAFGSIYLIRYALIGQRAFFLYLAVGLAVIFYAKLQKRPRFLMATVAALAAFFLVIYSFQVIRDAHKVGASKSGNSSSAFNQVFDGGSTEMLPSLAMAVQQRGTDWQLSPGSSIYNVAVHWVPSSVWAGKPRSYDEVLYSKWFPEQYSANKANTQFSLLGDFYTDLGLPGVIIGMVLFGAASSRIYLKFRFAENRSDMKGVALYATVPMLLALTLRGNMSLNAGIAAFLIVPLCAPVAFKALSGGPSREAKRQDWPTTPSRQRIPRQPSRSLAAAGYAAPPSVIHSPREQVHQHFTAFPAAPAVDRWAEPTSLIERTPDTSTRSTATIDTARVPSPGPRQKPGLLRRLAADRTLLLADQITSSGTNFVLLALAARTGDAHGLGVLALLLATYSVAIACEQALVGEPLLLAGAKHRGQRAGYLGIALLIGIAGGGITAGICVAEGSTSACWVALAVPFLVMQDAFRFAMFGQGASFKALASDLVWLIVLVGVAGYLELTSHPSAITFAVCWAVAGFIASVFVLAERRLIGGRLSWSGFLSANRDIWPSVLGENLLMAANAQLVLVLVLGFVGIAAAGVFRAAQSLFGPLNILINALRASFTRDLAMPGQATARAALRGSSATVSCVVLWMAAMVLTPLGHLLLGPTWTAARELVPVLGVQYVGLAAGVGAFAALRARRLALASLKVRAVVVAVGLVGATFGAVSIGARGAATGLAIASAIGATLLWRSLMIATRTVLEPS